MTMVGRKHPTTDASDCRECGYQEPMTPDHCLTWESSKVFLSPLAHNFPCARSCVSHPQSAFMPTWDAITLSSRPGIRGGRQPSHQLVRWGSVGDDKGMHTCDIISERTPTICSSRQDLSSILGVGEMMNLLVGFAATM